jgi:DNA-binding transcriptional regulator YdaS (Cro superfamily)
VSSKNETTVQAIALLGGISETSRKFNISRQAVFQWKDNGIPHSKVKTVCEMVDHQVTPHDLRPEKFTRAGRV